VEILDLRHFSSVDLRPLLDDETRAWGSLLSWDYNGSAEMILRYVDAKILPGDLLAPPAAIRTKDGRGLRVFTPFWRRVVALGETPITGVDDLQRVLTGGRIGEAVQASVLRRDLRLQFSITPRESAPST